MPYKSMIGLVLAACYKPEAIIVIDNLSEPLHTVKSSVIIRVTVLKISFHLQVKPMGFLPLDMDYR